MKCAPHRKGESSCFSRDELVEIAKYYNTFSQICKSKKQCIPVKIIENIDLKSKDTLYTDLLSRFQKLCKNDESCWVDLDFIDKIQDVKFVHNLKYFTFKPKMSGGRWQWLNTMDINFVLQQYQLVDPQFYFLGAQPSDFLEFKPDPINLDDLRQQNIKHIGLILNTDPHHKPGSHWVAIYIENLKTLEYFDSTGDLPNKHPYIKRCLTKLKKIFGLKKKDISINTKIHQTGSSECGVYSIYFIIQRLLGNDFTEITETIVQDKEMNLFRNFIFN
jgi:hypothetical protein